MYFGDPVCIMFIDSKLNCRCHIRQVIYAQANTVKIGTTLLTKTTGFPKIK